MHLMSFSDLPQPWGGMDYLCKGEVLTNTVLGRFVIRFVNNIWNGSFAYVENVLDCWDPLMKNGSKNKIVAFIFLFCVFTLTRI